MQLSQASQGSLDGHAPSLASPPVHPGPGPGPGGYNMHPHPQPSQNLTMNPYRSFGDATAHPPVPTLTKMKTSPQIYTAVYSGVSVYEMEVNSIAVMRRRADSWLNATQILKVAGVDKGKRTKVLEKEILTGEHEKVQGGYGKYQGTWINYHRGREFCRQYGVEELLRPLLEHAMSNDGKTAAAGSSVDTPTKEQAMAANRKRLYTALDGRQAGQGANGTFFSNISPTASNALAAMNKVNRMNSPAPRPPSTLPGSSSQRGSQQMAGSQDSLRGGSQQSRPGMQSQRSFGAVAPQDSTYGTQFADGTVDAAAGDEPPRKRMRPMSREQSFNQPDGPNDVCKREGTPTEANESFVYQQASQQLPSHSREGEVPVALPPLPGPTDKAGENKQSLLIDLFSDLNRTDFDNHPAILSLSSADLDVPLDQSANTALHWAATLARVPLVKLLIAKGANIFRGNSGGQTPLMAAVQVNNSLDHSCFNELLEILAPLIEVRDVSGRTILHHIAVSCGIKGRAASSKYYLEVLLEFLVRGATKPISLMRFMAEMVNARDRSGNTALNLVARIGNRSIIHQLVEVRADVHIANYKGLAPVDFGVFGLADKDAKMAMAGPKPVASPARSAKASSSRVDEVLSQLMPGLTAALANVSNQHTAEMRLKTDSFDRANGQIRDLATQYSALELRLSQLQARVKHRRDRGTRIPNLRRSLDERRRLAASRGIDLSRTTKGNNELLRAGDADKLERLDVPATSVSSSGSSHAAGLVNGDSLSTTVIDPNQLPDLRTLRARLAAYTDNNNTLRTLSRQLKARSADLELMYRKVIALCTGVEEDSVDECLASLLLAVESDNVGGADGYGVGGSGSGSGDGGLMNGSMAGAGAGAFAGTGPAGLMGMGMGGRMADAQEGRYKDFLRRAEGAGLGVASAAVGGGAY